MINDEKWCRRLSLNQQFCVVADKCQNFGIYYFQNVLAATPPILSASEICGRTNTHWACGLRHVTVLKILEGIVPNFTCRSKIVEKHLLRYGRLCCVPSLATGAKIVSENALRSIYEIWQVKVIWTQKRTGHVFADCRGWASLYELHHTA